MRRTTHQKTIDLIYITNRIGIRIKGVLLRNLIHVYWYESERNFGDLLNPSLFKYYGLTPLKTTGTKIEVVSIGSILDNLTEEYSGYILGSGLMHDEYRHFPKAKILAVRGKLTHERISAPSETTIGDPGLLISNLLEKRNEKKFVLGLVPHYHDKSDERLILIQNRYKNKVVIIDVQGKTKKVIEKIDQCQFILSSALHGIVAADSLGIPNGWISLSENVKGSGFKFRDYASAIDRRIEPIFITGNETLSNLCGETHTPPAKIEDIKLNLDSLFKSFTIDYLNEKRRY